MNSDARFTRLAGLLAMCVVAFLSAFANDPRIVPADHKEWSPNHAFFLEAKLREKRTRVFRAGKVQQMIWEIPSYLEIADVSNDGKHVASSYEGGNILDPGVRATDTLVTFYNVDGTTRAVTVADILPEFAHLPHSTAGQPWGRVMGFQPNGQLLIILNNGRHILLDPVTGTMREPRRSTAH